MASVEAPWDAFPELWKQGATDPMFNAYRSSVYTEGEHLSNQLQRAHLKDAARQQAIQDAVVSKLQSEMQPGEQINYDELPTKMRDLYAEAGDLSHAMEINSKILAADKEKHSEDSANLKDLLALKKAGAPDNVIQNFAEFYGLGDKLGDLNQLDFQEAPSYKGGLTEGIWHVGDDGKIVVDRAPKESAGSGSALQYVTMTKGNDTQFVDKKDPRAIQQLKNLADQGYKQKLSPMEEFLGLMGQMGGDQSGAIGGDASKEDVAGIPKTAPTKSAAIKNYPPPLPSELGPDGKPTAEGRKRYIQRVSGGIAGQ